MPLYKFTVKAGEKTYECERFVSGQVEERQIITVSGLGSKIDPSVYSDKLQLPFKMELNARLIAHQIIKEIQ